MAAKVKCPICGKMNDKTVPGIIKINRRYYCKECGEKFLEENEDGKSDWDRLFEYICELYNITKPTGMMFQQLKTYREEPYNYTDAGMLATLKYAYEIEQIPLKEESGLGIIPYVYDRCKEYYNELRIIDESANNYVKPTIKRMKIKLSERDKLIENRRQPMQFDEEDWEELDG